LVSKLRKDYRTEVLGFVTAFLDENGYPPTLEEIMASVGLSSKSHVGYYLSALEAAGKIERRPRSPRGLRLVGPEPSAFDVRVEGRIAAGAPMQLGHAFSQDLRITNDIADPRRELYALQVQGDSMIEAMVGDGDYVIVERRQEVARGQMAVVYLRDRNEATLKRVFPEGEKVRLQPAHPTMPAFYAHAREVEIQGRVVAIIRRP
jgi:repressor LexA